jgi:hypothetical protein
MEGDFVPWDVWRGEVTDFGRFVRYTCLLDSWLGHVDDNSRDGVGRVGVDTHYPTEFHPHPNLLVRFAQRCRCRTLTKVNVSAGESPFADLRLDAAPQQKDATSVDYETSGHQFRAGEIDKPATAANFEALMVRQHGSHPHRTSAQGTEAHVLRELMLNTMIRKHWGFVIGHCFTPNPRFP